MKLKNVKVFGFKTFAEPLSLDILPGVTAVVGPNGSGKSNLVDAVRWGLGEQSSKALRSGKTEDVIFAGNDRRKPLGLAEVALLFDNSDGRLAIPFEEVQITRRAYRAGEGEYYINRERVRLRDVLDLLGGTGLGSGSYAIVSQGQIDAILSSRPSERRALFEETAGIARFLARKEEALRRLERTEQNSIRLSDLLSELSRRIPELETQLRRAKRYRKIAARLRDFEILSYVRASGSRRGERTQLSDELQRLDELRAGLAARATALSSQLAALRQQGYTQELTLDQLRARSREQSAQLAQREADQAANRARFEALQSQSTATSEDRERSSRERAQLEERIAGAHAEIEPLRSALDMERVAEAAAHGALERARQEVEAVYASLQAVGEHAEALATQQAERRVQIDHVRSERGRIDKEATELADRIARLELDAGHRARSYRERETALVAMEQKLAASRDQIARADAELAEAQHAIDEAQRSLAEASAQLAGSEARLHTIEEMEASFEGHVAGTRAVLEARGHDDLRGIEGVVSDLIRLEERYARALDAAFGARLSNIITATADDARRAVEYLNARSLGRATFLPLELLARRQGKELVPGLRRPGVIGYAHTLVEVEPRFAGVVAFLVGGVLVVDTLATGIELVRDLKLHETIVSLGGEQIVGGGAISGGRYRNERSILSRRVQAQQLREEIPRLRARVDDAAAALERMREHSARLVRERDAARTEAARSEDALGDLRAELVPLGIELETTALQSAELRERLEAAHRRASELHADELRFEREDQPKLAGDEERREFESRLAAAREQSSACEQAQRAAAERVAALRERLAALSAVEEAAGARLRLLDEDRERAESARTAVEDEVERLRRTTHAEDAALAELRTAIGADDDALREAQGRREALTTETTRLESDLQTARLEEREAGERVERARLRLAELEAELGMLVATFAQNPATETECEDVERRYAEVEAEPSAELPKLREEIARLANVNLNAEAEREEVASRERFLREQMDDLARARQTLLDGIAEIDRSTQGEFNRTFDAVSEAFSGMFARLFPGGQARMWQTNPERLDESGIELTVQPPGKKMMSLNALSGGERAMTAAALIFALIEVRPSPFYLLDEVDAALDDANVERFSEMVREFAAGGAQLLLVTHNKKTMELADRLYGVTMAEPGLSTVISAELSEQSEPAIA